MAQGHDGFEALARGRSLVDDECGLMLSTIVRQYLLGSQYVNKMIRLKDSNRSFVNAKTKARLDILRNELTKEKESQREMAAKLWKHATTLAIHHVRSTTHYQNHFKISVTEHMSAVDSFDGERARKSLACTPVSYDENEDLLLVTPEVDGRLKDEGNPSTGMHKEE